MKYRLWKETEREREETREGKSRFKVAAAVSSPTHLKHAPKKGRIEEVSRIGHT